MDSLKSYDTREEVQVDITLIERYRVFKFEWDSFSLSSGNTTTQARYIARADTLAKHLDAHIKGTAP